MPNSWRCSGYDNIGQLTSAQGLVVARYIYDSFGNLLGKSGPMADVNLYRFSSKEYNANSDLTYYGFRFYDANLQRWINRDPIGESGGMNLYGFVGNGPVSDEDPFGLEGVNDFSGLAWKGNYGVAVMTRPFNVVNMDTQSHQNVADIAVQVNITKNTYVDFANPANPPVITRSVSDPAPVDTKVKPESRFLPGYVPPEYQLVPTAPYNMSQCNLNDLRPDQGLPPAAQAFLGLVANTALAMLTDGLGDVFVALADELGALKTANTADRAFWMGQNGLAAATKDGANLLKLSPEADAAFNAGNYAPMQAESAAWAAGATGNAKVYVGNGAGRTFWSFELPQLLNNVNSGQLNSIKYIFLPK